jgi:DnaJ-class molecular chaperone
MSLFHSHYDNLFVAKNAPTEVIRAAYRALAQKYHPDKNKSQDAERVMKLVNEAWKVLSDPALRREHDEVIERRSRSGSQVSPPQKRAAQETPKRDTGFNSGHKTAIDQASLAEELEPLAVKLWFESASRESVLSFLKAHGLEDTYALALVHKIFH